MSYAYDPVVTGTEYHFAVFPYSAAMAYGRPARAVGFVSADVPLNSTTTGLQARPVVTDTFNDQFAVAWESLGQDGDGYGVYTRLFEQTGLPAIAEVQVHDATAGDQTSPGIAKYSAGWTVAYKHGNFTTYQRPNTRGFNNDGTPATAPISQGPENSDNDSMAIATTPMGKTVIAWMNPYVDNNPYWDAGVSTKLLNDDGTQHIASFVAPTTLAGNQYSPDVGTFQDSAFAVTWQSDGQDGSGNGVYVKKFSDVGATLIDELRVNSKTTGHQDQPSLATLNSDQFAVAFRGDYTTSGGAEGIFARAFNAAGTPINTNDVQINSTTTGSMANPKILEIAFGTYLITWTASNMDGSGSGVIGRLYDSQLSPLSLEFVVPAYTTGNQTNGSSANAYWQRIGITWHGEGTGDADGAFMRIFSLGLNDYEVAGG